MLPDWKNYTVALAVVLQLYYRNNHFAPITRETLRAWCKMFNINDL